MERQVDALLRHFTLNEELGKLKPLSLHSAFYVPESVTINDSAVSATDRKVTN